MTYKQLATRMKPELITVWRRLKFREQDEICEKASRSDGMSTDGFISESRMLRTLEYYVGLEVDKC